MFKNLNYCSLLDFCAKQLAWAFDSANVSWAFDITNENWALMLPMKIGL